MAEITAALGTLAAVGFASRIAYRDREDRLVAQAIQADVSARDHRFRQAEQRSARRAYADQVSWWLTPCVHDPELKDTGRGDQAVQIAKPGTHRPYIGPAGPEAPQWQEGAEEYGRFMLADLHIKNTGKHPIYSAGIKVHAREQLYFIGRIDPNVSDTFSQYVRDASDGGSTGSRYLADIDAGGRVEYIHFTDAAGRNWQKMRTGHLRRLPASQRLTYPSY